MGTLFLVLFILLLLMLLGLLYRYTPNRKIFWCFCLMLSLTGGLAYYFALTNQPAPSVMTEEEKFHLQQQQEIFTAWYADYQKDIEQLDRNWQWYHTIVENFKENTIDLQTAYVRLHQLEEDSKQLHEQIAQKKPPLALDDGCYDLLIEVMKKTDDYAAAQYRTIALTRAVADPVHIRSNDPVEQNRAIQETMLRESPSGLFIAAEISAIREYLTITEEQQ